jgi:hypothetical protein
VFTLRGDNGKPTGGWAIDSNPGWKWPGMGCDGPIGISGYQRCQWLREQMQTEGVEITLPMGN